VNTGFNPQSSDFGVCFSSHRLLDFPLFVAIAVSFSLFLICLLTGCFRNISFILIHCKEFKIVFFFSFTWWQTSVANEKCPLTTLFTSRLFSYVFFVFDFFQWCFLFLVWMLNLLPFQVELKSKCSFLFHTNINRKKYNFLIKIVLCWGIPMMNWWVILLT